MLHFCARAQSADRLKIRDELKRLKASGALTKAIIAPDYARKYLASHPECTLTPARIALFFREEADALDIPVATKQEAQSAAFKRPETQALSQRPRVDSRSPIRLMISNYLTSLRSDFVRNHSEQEFSIQRQTVVDALARLPEFKNVKRTYIASFVSKEAEELGIPVIKNKSLNELVTDYLSTLKKELIAKKEFNNYVLDPILMARDLTSDPTKRSNLHRSLRMIGKKLGFNVLEISGNQHEVVRAERAENAQGPRQELPKGKFNQEEIINSRLELGPTVTARLFLQQLKQDLTACKTFESYVLDPIRVARLLEPEDPKKRGKVLQALRKYADEAGFTVDKTDGRQHALFISERVTGNGHAVQSYLRGLKNWLMDEGIFEDYELQPYDHVRLIFPGLSDASRMLVLIRNRAEGLGFTLSKEKTTDLEEYQQRRDEQSRLANKNPELRTRRSEYMTEKWEDPSYRNKMAEHSKKRWKDPYYRSWMIKILIQRWKDPVYRVHMSSITSQRLKDQWQDPIYREHMSAISSDTLKRQWQDPEFRKKISALTSERSRRLWQDPEYRNRVIQSMYTALGERRRWVTQVVSSVNRETGQIIDVVDPNQLTPEELFIEKETLTERAEQIEAARKAFEELEQTNPIAHLLLQSIFGFTDGIEDDIAALNLTEEDEQTIINDGLNFLRNKLGADSNMINPFQVSFGKSISNNTL